MAFFNNDSNTYNSANMDSNQAMGWDDVIENDGQEFLVLDDGDYNFTVTNFERGHFPGSAKLCPCNKATLTLQVQLPEGIANVRTDLILHRALEFRIAAFLRCVGLKKHGERLCLDWNKVVGTHGRAHFHPRTYTDKYGNERKTNDVERFYDYDTKFFAQTQAVSYRDMKVGSAANEANIPF